MLLAQCVHVQLQLPCKRCCSKMMHNAVVSTIAMVAAVEKTVAFICVMQSASTLTSEAKLLLGYGNLNKCGNL